MFESFEVREWQEGDDQTLLVDVGSGFVHNPQVYTEPDPEASRQGEDQSTQAFL